MILQTHPWKRFGWAFRPTPLCMLAACLALLLVGSGTPVHAGPTSPLTITATFDSSITNDPNASAIEGVINSAVSYYQSTFTTATASPINVQIYFKEMTTGLGQSNTTNYSNTYSSVLTGLTNASSGDTTDTTALAHLPAGPNNPVTGSSTMVYKSADGRALGFNAPGLFAADGSFNTGGSYDGIISLNTLLTTPGSNGSSLQYSLLAVTEHEMDEVLGLGSDVSGTGFFANPAIEDLYRYDNSGNRSYTANSSAQAFFSLDGTTQIAQFDNQNDGGDWGDWQSNPLPNGVPPKVQDAFATPGSTPTLANDGGAEITALDAVGYNLTSQVSATPEPASLTLLAIGMGGIAFYFRRRQTAKTV